MRKLPAVVLFCIVSTCSGQKKATPPGSSPAPGGNAPPSSYHFSEPWNRSFHCRETENGEIMAIGAVFSDSTGLYIYDLADGAVVCMDTSLNVTKTVRLAPIGRNTWVGDDFVVRDSVFIFLNSIDRRLEFFSRATGAHVNSMVIPSDLLSDVGKRSRRLLSRLFILNDQLYIGNDYHLAVFDPVAGKRRAGQALLSAGEGRRYLLPRTASWITENDSGLVEDTPGSWHRMPQTHHPIAGKRLFSLHGVLYTVSAGKDSITIGKLQ